MNKMAAVLRESGPARFFIPAGIILIICGFVFLNAGIQNKDYIRTESTVLWSEMEEEYTTDEDGSHVEETWNAHVKYTVDGKDYEAELDGVSRVEAGDKMTIYYNPADPGQITQTKSLLIPAVMIIAGIAAAAAGVISAFGAVRKYKKMREQEQDGLRRKNAEILPSGRFSIRVCKPYHEQDRRA